MIVNINKGRAKGKVSAPPSKSMAHRLLICAAISQGESIIHGMSDCEDVRATLDCLSALGVPFESYGDTVKVKGIGFGKFTFAMQRKRKYAQIFRSPLYAWRK